LSEKFLVRDWRSLYLKLVTHPSAVVSPAWTILFRRAIVVRTMRMDAMSKKQTTASAPPMAIPTVLHLWLLAPGNSDAASLR